ncbi:hypothetical protein [Bifidobacterium sp. ESL0728]|uniref:hypothetical protein n=1 Tax=Bifidobacterium sp. ESL0728 TaxID=2983220 RepID=UPI0032AE9F30
MADDAKAEVTEVAPMELANNPGNGIKACKKSNSRFTSNDEHDFNRSHQSSSQAKAADDLSLPLDSGVTCDKDSDKVHILTLQQIEQTIKDHLTGDIEQVPSSYSAVRVNGRHAYELARQGKAVELDARPVTISEFAVLGARNVEASYAAENGKDTEEKTGYSETLSRNISGVECEGNPYAASNSETMGEPAEAVNGVKKSKAAEPSISLVGTEHHTSAVQDVLTAPVASKTSVVDVDVRISCSTGTYIRSLGRDLGELLGVGGYLTKLRRTRVGKFDLADPQLANRVVTAHAKPHTFTNREGVTLTLNKAVLDVDADELKRRSLTMFEAAQRTMPVIPITQHDAAELRYGRRLKMNLDQAVDKAFETVEASSGESAQLSGRQAVDEAFGTAGSGSDTAKIAKSDSEVVPAEGPAFQVRFAAAYVPETGEVVAILEPANDSELKSAVVFPPVKVKPQEKGLSHMRHG